jgi:hypothetical protein
VWLGCRKKVADSHSAVPDAALPAPNTLGFMSSSVTECQRVPALMCQLGFRSSSPEPYRRGTLSTHSR